MNTSTALFMLWVLFTLVMMAMSIVSMLSVQSVIDRLRVIDMKNWGENTYTPLKKVVLDNMIWILLVSIGVTEMVSLAFEPVRFWFRENLLLALAVYIVPIIVILGISIVQRIRANMAEATPPSEEENGIEGEEETTE